MTGKGRELADMMERRKVDILCVQETRWKGSKARSIGARFKLFYYGVDSKRNGVGVVLKEEFVRNVLEVERVSDRVMTLKLEIEGVMLNDVSGYAPQVGCELEEKERFWSELDEVMESIPTGERVVIGADFNGHVGEGNRGDEEVMGKFGVKERNLEGQMVVDFAKRMDMAVVNIYFQKKEEHRVTYKSGVRRTQRKRLAKKKWDMDRTEENRQEYKELQRRVKREVSKAKHKTYDELYTRLDTREGEKDLYRLARQRDRDGKDVQQVRVIKDRDGRVLTSEESVQRRWKEYFEELMNEENEREKRIEGVNSVEQKVDKIRKDEVRKALKRMKSGKAVGFDDIPVEVWKCLGEAAVEFLTSLFNRVLENLEKAYDRVPREELWYCMRKSGVAEKYVRVVQDMYERSRTVVRCAIVMDQLSEEVRQESPWTMMFADDIVICSESREQVEENLERWREGSGTVRLQGEEVKKLSLRPCSYGGAPPHDVASVGGAAPIFASGGEFWQYLAPTLPPLGEFLAPSEMEIVALELSFVGGRRSALLLGGGRRSALLLGGGRRSALLLDCGRLSTPPLGCGRRVGPFGLAVGSCAPPTCLAPASHSPHVPRLDPRSPHLPRLGPRFHPLALLLLLAPPQVPRPASCSPHRPLYAPCSSSGPIAGPDFRGGLSSPHLCCQRKVDSDGEDFPCFR
ncbi:hypothetical protein QTP70_008387 [Hemibagrus guttatus]|uniref:Endonuclease/exonuclease/phosphatase domain-containing protein n=1 Tax=Hemibagrus guttatus TaxID=175788 RepID=A0AAE0PX85_9TELE|nr:hypothetical protein QTP70_008387 [Hemibagrus guttatus]